jgi:hypothetical protein
MSTKSIGKYYGNLRAALGEVSAKAAAALLVATWVTFPVAVQSLLHPMDVAGFGYYLQGGAAAVPRYYTSEQVSTGEIKAFVALVVIGVIAYLGARLFYASAKFSVALWPVAGLLTGVVGNIAWWFHSAPSPSGSLSGLSTVALMVLCQGIIEYFAQDATFGKGVRPQRA